MPKARSEEFRMLVVNGVEDKGLTIAAASALFEVGTASVKRWVSQYRATRSVRPKDVGGLRMVWIGADEKEQLLDLLKAMPDASLQELVDAWHQRKPVGRVSSARTIRDHAKKSLSVPQKPKRRA